jgi:hypothetical protein
MDLKENTVVTYDFGTSSSNTCNLDTIEDFTVLVSHPLAPGILIRLEKARINTVSANGKDSTERALDFANANKNMLDHNTRIDLFSLGLFFVVGRRLTPRQKHALANICGILAANKFNEDLKSAMSFVSQNIGLLDEFNLMWYNNFKGLFSGKQPVTSKKQRGAIFNIAGYVLAELETPSVPK